MQDLRPVSQQTYAKYLCHLKENKQAASDAVVALLMDAVKAEALYLTLRGISHIEGEYYPDCAQSGKIQIWVKSRVGVEYNASANTWKQFTDKLIQEGFEIHSEPFTNKNYEGFAFRIRW